MNCTVADREQLRRAASAIRDSAPTVAVDVRKPAASQHDAWTLDAVVRDQQGVPPEILRELALAGLTLRPSPSRGDHVAVVATL